MGNMVKAVLGFIAAALIVVAAVYFVRLSGRETLPEGLVQANGRIEGDRITAAGKFAGRILETTVKEGDWVEAGQVMVHMDDAQVQAKVAQAREAYEAGCAQVRAHEAILAAMDAEIPIGVEAAKAGVEHAEAVMGKAKAVMEQAEKDAERFRELAERETVSRHELEKAELGLSVAKQDFFSAKIGVVVARKQLAQAILGFEKIKAKEEEVKAHKAVCQQAQAVVSEAESVMNDLTIRAPCKGVVMEKTANTGEVVSAGSPLFGLVDLDQLYLKAYIPEKEIGKVSLGQEAMIYTDAFPDQPLPARVTYIASQAQFTPKEVQTPDERVKLVYEVKVSLDDNPGRRFTPGLPSDVVIRWKKEIPWAKPVW
ncbi:HlyD family secretion protein [Desulfatibacillum aliphaticivorans]|uniref:HlyD family secretion protein n=1 Tax=Desulfatibacillum aliphaticivorans TaxID=218208 RepID=UPI0004007C41|nr:HlyD family efflux transporter periplasmic adaptor subunit [Desulfatibacillum aliphaticivorans]